MRIPHSFGARNSARKAFTLMEIMLVVTIIALLAGLAIFKMQNVIIVGQIASAKTDIQSFCTNLVAYRSMAGTYPSTAQGLQALVKRPEGDPKPLMWHSLFEGDVKKDPWGHDFVYQCPGTKHPDSYDLYSLGEDGKAGTSDDIFRE